MVATHVTCQSLRAVMGWVWFSDKRLSRFFFLLLLPGFSVFDDLVPVSQFSFFKSFITSSLRLFFSRSLFLTPIGFQPIIFLTSFTSPVPLRCPHHMIPCAFTYLTISSFINFSNSLLLPILHPFLPWIRPSNFLNMCLQRTNKLCMSNTDSVQVSLT